MLYIEEVFLDFLRLIAGRGDFDVRRQKNLCICNLLVDTPRDVNRVTTTDLLHREGYGIGGLSDLSTFVTLRQRCTLSALTRCIPDHGDVLQANALWATWKLHGKLKLCDFTRIFELADHAHGVIPYRFRHTSGRKV